jgi:hypothetical protein
MPPYTATRPIPPEIRDQLNKLMLVLGSVNEGESAAAAGRITGLLKRHGLDWHDIVGSIGQAARSAPKPPPRQAKSYPTGRQQSMSAEELKALVHLILRSPLNNKARQFLAAMVDRAQIYGSVQFSDRQWMWLQDLARRAGAI